MCDTSCGLKNKISTNTLPFVLLKLPLQCQGDQKLISRSLTTAAIGVILLARRHICIHLVTSHTAVGSRTARVILSQKNEVVRYIRLERPKSAAQVEQHFIKPLIAWSM